MVRCDHGRRNGDKVQYNQYIQGFAPGTSILKNAQIHEPKSFGFKAVKQEELHGGKTIASNAKIFMDILKGKGTSAQNNVVIANAALAISLYEENSYHAALRIAQQSLYSGNALESFENLKAIQ